MPLTRLSAEELAQIKARYADRHNDIEANHIHALLAHIERLQRVEQAAREVAAQRESYTSAFIESASYYDSGARLRMRPEKRHEAAEALGRLIAAVDALADAPDGGKRDDTGKELSGG